MSKVENKVEEIKEELKDLNETELVVKAETKGKKILGWCLKGLALIATGVAGFFIGRTTVGGEDEAQEEETKE